MNWSKSLEGAGAAVVTFVVASLPGLFSGGITKNELIGLGIAAACVFFAYLKEHPPVAQ